MDDNTEKEIEHCSEGDAGAGAGAAEEQLRAAEEALASEADGDEDGEQTEGEKKPSRLQKRIKSLVEARKSYERFGKPDDLQRKLDKLAEYEQLEKRVKAEQAAAARRQREETGEAEVARKFRAYMDQTFGPGAADEFMSMRRSREEREYREAQTYAKAGRDHIVSILRENAVPTEDPAVVQAYEHTMATFIGENPELHAKYLDPNTQRDALAAAFKFAGARLLNPMLAAAGAGTYEQIAARKARALGSARGTSAGTAVDIADEKPPKGSTPEQIHEWHKRRASRAWDAALDADEAGA